MKHTSLFIVTLMTAVLAACPPAHSDTLNVVTTFSDFAAIAREIGGERVSATYLSQGDQDPHFVAPKPSLALSLRKADLFVTTGMDLEVWATTLLDKARNRDIMDGSVGYVTASTGIDILEKPTSFSRSEGDIHVSGNPHIQTSPINWRTISENILIGLIKVDPAGEDYYRERQKAFVDRVDRAMYGDELVGLIGGDKLVELHRAGRLMEFLGRDYQGAPLESRLGGWMKEALPFRGMKVVAYHKNWAYFARDFGLEIVGFIEPKPGIPPTPQHVQTMIDLIGDQGVSVMLVAGYFERRKPTTIAQKTGIEALFMPISVDATPDVPDNFRLVSYWIRSINDAIGATSAAPGAE